jgi:hypothetical protein
MKHSPDHDPTVDHGECFTCAAALRLALNRIADMDLGPAEAEQLIRTIRLTALGFITESGEYVSYPEPMPMGRGPGGSPEWRGES